MHSNCPVPNYLPQAILVTLFCCVPFGIVAIFYAAQVNTKYTSGDTEAAVTASDNAKKWCWISFISGAIILVLYVIASLALGY
ncbi:MAG: CD225/dispanin family protein [Moorea sp. SIO4E2]|uniref:CD225/dispanin family protein n=1 Tax=Moorena sp. SIO4E2 TaxID=2607826 RepID=UPI0013B8E0F9|nr:CD225/dispanin family protein [Moorena sp. SIO4E2]